MLTTLDIARRLLAALPPTPIGTLEVAMRAALLLLQSMAESQEELVTIAAQTRDDLDRIERRLRSIEAPGGQ